MLDHALAIGMFFGIQAGVAEQQAHHEILRKFPDCPAVCFNCEMAELFIKKCDGRLALLGRGWGSDDVRAAREEAVECQRVVQDQGSDVSVANLQHVCAADPRFTAPAWQSFVNSWATMRFSAAGCRRVCRCGGGDWKIHRS